MEGNEYEHIFVSAMRVITKHKLLNYVLKNYRCAERYHLNENELSILQEAVDYGKSISSK